MATYADLILTAVSPFNAELYIDYSSTGFRSQDKHFLTEDAKTHVFRKASSSYKSDRHALLTNDSQNGTLYHVHIVDKVLSYHATISNDESAIRIVLSLLQTGLSSLGQFQYSSVLSPANANAYSCPNNETEITTILNSEDNIGLSYIKATGNE